MKFIIRVSIEAAEPKSNPLDSLIFAMPMILSALGVKLPHAPDCPENPDNLGTEPPPVGLESEPPK